MKGLSAAICAAATLLAGCGPGDTRVQEAPGAIDDTVVLRAGTPPGAATLMVAQDSERGSYLTDAHGRALYVFSGDAPATTRCVDACARSWPPLVADEPPQAGDAAVQPNLISSVERPEGLRQITYNGMPLYYFARDAAPGDIGGHDVNAYEGEWYLMSPEGRAVGRN